MSRTCDMNYSRSCTFFPHATSVGRGLCPVQVAQSPASTQSIPHNLSRLCLCRFPQGLGFDQWRIYQVLAEEPNLQLVSAKHIAHYQVVGARVAQLVGTLGQLAARNDDDLVRVQQARQLHGNLFASLGRAWNARRFCYVCCHGDTDTAQKLDSFRDGVDDLALLSIVLIEQKMKLIESGSGHLPMGLLVEIPESHGVGQQ